MKKTLVYSLAVAMLLVSLTACNKPQANQQDTSQPDPATTSSSVDVSTPEPPAEPEPEPPEVPAPEQLSNTTVAAPVENEDPQDQAEPVAQEPAEPEPSQDQPVVVDPFTEVNETVYATGGVNLRSGPGTGYEKVGSLKWGDSVTRTGIGTNEAKGWSRIVVGEKTVCVSNSYISTTKPETKPAQKPVEAQTPVETQQPAGEEESREQDRLAMEAAGHGEAILNEELESQKWEREHGHDEKYYEEKNKDVDAIPEGFELPPGATLPDPSSKWYGKAYIDADGTYRSFRKIRVTLD